MMEWAAAGPSRAAPAAPRPAGPGVPPRQPAAARIAVIGAHGGAGASTLAALLAPSLDLGTVCVPGLQPGRPVPPGAAVVLAARCTTASAARAVAAVSALERQGAVVAVLAVTGDGLPEPAGAAYRFAVLEGRTGALVRVPFIPALRAADSPRLIRLPRAAVRALDLIRALAGPPGGPDQHP